MDDLLQELAQMNQRMVLHLFEAPYEELESFVEDRQKLVDAIGRQISIEPPTDAQKRVISHILEHDGVLLDRMNDLRLEAQDWLQKRNQAKAQRSAYEVGYTPDSILMDRKK
jgi:AraC-like DNA-binding protein